MTSQMMLQKWRQKILPYAFGDIIKKIVNLRPKDYEEAILRWPIILNITASKAEITKSPTLNCFVTGFRQRYGIPEFDFDSRFVGLNRIVPSPKV